MKINKVIFNEKTLLDLTGDTVTSDTLTKGTVAHDARGESIVGTLDTDTIYQNGFNAGANSVSVVLQEKTVTPTTSVQNVTADAGFNGLSKVTVNTIPQSILDTYYQNGYVAGSSGSKEGKHAWRKYAVGSVLPSGYQQREYIQSSDADNYCINTGVTIGSSDSVVEMDIQNMTTISAQNFFLQFGVNYATSTGAMIQIGAYGSKWSWHMPNITVDGSTAMTANRTKVIFSISGNKFTLGGDVGGSFTNSYISSGSYRNNPITLLRGIWRCYGAKIYVGNNLVRDLIPCINPSGAVGMYDIVNGVFYANTKTGSFTYGGTSYGSIFQNYVVSDDVSAYPDGGTQDGYWYEKSA